jgi:phosphoglycerate dehydrogenase-like enzyme
MPQEAAMPSNAPLKILIASPLEPEQAARIAAAPGRIEVIYEPDLLPEPRYVADHKGRSRELSQEQRARWVGHLREADILFDFDWLASERLVEHAPRLRWVQATSAGIGERLRSTGLIESDILFTTAAGVHASSLAEFTILGLLYFYRDVPRLQRMQKAHHWQRYTNRELAGRRALVVGLGAVGGTIAKRIAGMGLEVWGARRSFDAAAPEGVDRVLPLTDLRSVLGEIDALILACPLTPETAGLIGAAEFAALPQGALLINVARGRVVDEQAMIRALSEGHLGGAVLDVAKVEPLPADSPLWDLPNVLISPHSASTVDAENARIVDIFLANLARYQGGEPLLNRFDPKRGY